jgi:hypothetical protein
MLMRVEVQVKPIVSHTTKGNQHDQR